MVLMMVWAWRPDGGLLAETSGLLTLISQVSVPLSHFER